MEIQGTVAVITGGASGIGRASAIALAARGAVIVVADLDDAGGAETVAAITAAGGRAIFRHCDTTDSGQLERTIRAANDEFGRLDIVYNNAGVGGEDLFGDEPGP